MNRDYIVFMMKRVDILENVGNPHVFEKQNGFPKLTEHTENFKNRYRTLMRSSHDSAEALGDHRTHYSFQSSSYVEQWSESPHFGYN